MATIFKLGSRGNEVEKIQSKLKEENFYPGPIDGIYGGGTESAVKRFQRQYDLTVDGMVGTETWQLMFGNTEIPQSPLLDKPLAYRCLALTGSFETSCHPPDCFAGLTGDFDGQGISFGALQWNFGQNSLQPLLKKMNQENPAILKEIFDDEYQGFITVLGEDQEKQMEWTRSIQDPANRINEPWKGLFKTLGRTKEFQDIEVEEAANMFNVALTWCEKYEVWSERAAALMFDIRVQNGNISNPVKNLILNDFNALSATLNENDREAEKLKIIANRRAEASRARFIEDVRRRKLCIANGKGMVHGQYYNLDSEFGITLKKINP